MKKVILAICVSAICVIGYSQSGNNQIGVGADLALPMGDFGDGVKTGFGGYAKGLFGIGEAGQITFTTGYSSFKLKGLDPDESGTASIIPLLAGYRHNFSGFYVEPQVGYNIFGAKVKILGQSSSDSNGGFAYAIGLGYVVNNVDFGVRYQGGKPSDSGGDSSDWSIIGIHVGYNFSLGGSK
ncbi:MAG: outer membrane beta-barrel protein [Chitinophagaceae bacterium]